MELEKEKNRQEGKEGRELKKAKNKKKRKRQKEGKNKGEKERMHHSQLAWNVGTDTTKSILQL